MPRAPDPRRAQAREMWESSGKTMKLREIAAHLQVPEKTISGWKCKDGWDKKNERSTPKNKRSTPIDTPKRKRGAQPGHPPQGGAKPGNNNAVVTGAYMRIYGDLLTDEEKEIVADIIDQSAERRASLLQLLASLKLRERRILKDISDIRTGKEMLIRRTVSQIDPTGKKNDGGQDSAKVIRISQEQESRREMLQRFEDALTRIQAEIRRTEDSLRQVAEADAKNNNNENSIANDWIAALIGGNVEDD